MVSLFSLCLFTIYLPSHCGFMMHYIDVLNFGLEEKLGVLGKKFQDTQTYGLKAGRLKLLVDQFLVL